MHNDIIDSNLYAAAVGAAGPAPQGVEAMTGWLGRVGQIYTSLLRERTTLVARLELIAKIEAPKEVRERGYGIAVGILREAREEHGRGILILESELESEFNDGLDTFRTTWLNEGGAEILDAARGLVGQRVRVWKYPEAHSKKPGQTVRMCAQIAPAMARGGHDDDGGAPKGGPRPSVDHREAAARPTADPSPVGAVPEIADAFDGAAAPVNAVRSVVYCVDGTTPVDDVRDLSPENTRRLRQLAKDHLGFEQARVTSIARQILQGAPQRNERTAAELRTVWRALVATYLRDQDETRAA